MNRSKTLERIGVDAVVELAPGVAGVQSPAGGLVLREQLGPGIVREIGEADKAGEASKLRIHWVEADLDTWVEHEEVEARHPAARLIAVYRCDAQGGRTLERYMVVTSAGLTHNWTVEIMPANVLRTVRLDGLAWTFDWNPWFEQAQPVHTILDDPLAEEDHAEAITVAELAAT